MWKRDEAVKPGVTTDGPRTETPKPSGSDTVSNGISGTVGTIGKSVVIKGELSASEDLTIEGTVEGKVELKQNVLTIGANGKIKASVFAKAVIVQGEVTGNISASEKIDIRDAGSVDGDLASPRVAIADGAHFRGSIDMQRAGSKPGDSAKPSDTPKPAEAAKPSGGAPSSGSAPMAAGSGSPTTGAKN
jgi:cytoskeletal protein CcmA (bactofilin family)